MQKRFVIQLILSFWVFAFATNTLFAHTALSESTPPNGAMLSQAPDKLQLKYTENVRLLRAKLMRGEEEVEINFHASAAQSKEFAIPLPTLEHGHYTVSWAVMGEDSHTVEGSFGFMLGMMNHSDASQAVHENEAHHDRQQEHDAADNGTHSHDHN